MGGRDVAFGVATRYRLYGPGFEHVWERFSPTVYTDLKAHPASCAMRTLTLQ
jgi:hypothetical protein